MKIDWDKIDDIDDYTPVEAGKYKVEVKEVIEETSNDGDEYWRIKLEIIGGEYDGRIVTDNIFFTEKALPRAKIIWGSLGLETKGIKHEKPEKLLERKCFIFVEIGSYTDDEGNKKPKNVIPFAGYEHLEGKKRKKDNVAVSEKKGKKAAKDEEEDDIPF